MTEPERAELTAQAEMLERQVTRLEKSVSEELKGYKRADAIGRIFAYGSGAIFLRQFLKQNAVESPPE